MEATTETILIDSIKYDTLEKDPSRWLNETESKHFTINEKKYRRSQS